MARNSSPASAKSRHFQWERTNISLLLSKFAEARNVDGQKCSFDARAYHFWFPVLGTAVRAMTPEAARLKERCISASLSDSFVTLRDAEAFLLRCDQQFEVLSKRTKTQFVLYTTITYSGPRLVDWISEGRNRIYWGPSADGNLLRKIRTSQAAIESKRASLKLPTDDDLTPVLVHLSAYDAADAFETANDCIDRFRGLVNLLINSSKSINIFAQLSQPHAMNRIRRGPLHTIHRKDGSLATETFWYEHRWLHHVPSIKFSNSQDYRRSVQRWWRMLQQNPMHEFIADALLRYCRALDMHDADASFLGMWQVLERLTGTDRYDQLIERIVRLFKDPDDTREIAKHLRLRRNQAVHSTSSISEEADVILMQAETLASRAIFFLIKHAAKFKTIDEYYSFLDLPLDERRLKREREIADFFLKYKNRP
ncbi:hypothetical protein [Bradyrhizobium sp. 930_D9_N1_4]|uniref:hypothetical protein n=1 Tax=Bradyrhizobium sp. 930_D9_N1_4 TaxID=3240374 RepID=UPI003F8B5986